jgi:imidazolonepropionase-like amidohydrolase
MSPKQILAAATLESARLFGLEKDYGTIAPGKVASLLLLREDPLASTTAFDTIDTVVVKGRVIPRETLTVK